MARPKSEDKRNAILAAATQVIAEQGLGAPTARIAKVAGVAEGTLFTYFESKDVLLNELYLDIKAGMREVMMTTYPESGSQRARSAPSTCGTSTSTGVWRFPAKTPGYGAAVRVGAPVRAARGQLACAPFAVDINDNDSGERGERRVAWISRRLSWRRSCAACWRKPPWISSLANRPPPTVTARPALKRSGRPSSRTNFFCLINE